MKWTEKDIKLLRYRMEVEGYHYTDLEKEFNRNNNAIRQKAFLLGIKSKHKKLKS